MEPHIILHILQWICILFALHDYIAYSAYYLEYSVHVMGLCVNFTDCQIAMVPYSHMLLCIILHILHINEHILRMENMYCKTFVLQCCHISGISFFLNSVYHFPYSAYCCNIILQVTQWIRLNCQFVHVQLSRFNCFAQTFEQAWPAWAASGQLHNHSLWTWAHPQDACSTLGDLPLLLGQLSTGQAFHPTMRTLLACSSLC
jgi:hypothetical protein